MSNKYVCKRKYEVRVEDVGTCDMVSAYTPDGDYIGTAEDAYRIVCNRGIAPEKAFPDHQICSVGFCEEEQKWYGWSHRAIQGFGIGSKVTKEDLAYRPSRENKDEIVNNFNERYKNEKDVSITEASNGIGVSYQLPVFETNPDGSITAVPGKYRTWHDIQEYGRGEWEAKTLEDARIMACDFAEAVS